MSLTSPVDMCFAKVKETRLWLENITSSVERGTPVDFATVTTTVEPLILQLDTITKGQVPRESGPTSSPLSMPPIGIRSSTTSSSPFPYQPQNISSYSSLRSTSQITELQKRKAETLATQLRQSLDHLQRCHVRNEARAQYTAAQRELLGSGGAPTASASELELQQKEEESLRYMKRRFAQMEEESAEVLQAIRNQGQRLTRSGQRVNSIVDQLGLGNSVLGQIMKRNRTDAAIVFVGIFLLLLLMWKIWTR